MQMYVTTHTPALIMNSDNNLFFYKHIGRSPSRYYVFITDFPLYAM